MTVRTNPVTGATDYLGVVGRDYTPVQNEACAELLDLLIDASGAHFETAGSLRGGRRVFVTLKLPDGMSIAGVDDLDLYLALSTSHDGSTALRVDATPVRVVCANTQRLALQRSVGHYTFRHTSSIKAKIAQARQAIGITYAYADAFAAEAERMLDTSPGPRPVPGRVRADLAHPTRRRDRPDQEHHARRTSTPGVPAHATRPPSRPSAAPRGPAGRPSPSTSTSTPPHPARRADPNAYSHRPPSPGSSSRPTTCSPPPDRSRSVTTDLSSRGSVNRSAARPFAHPSLGEPPNGAQPRAGLRRLLYFPERPASEVREPPFP